MAFLNTPDFNHQHAQKTAVLLVNLGTPSAPTKPAVHSYLAQFLSDPRVVEIPRLVWLTILHGIILRIRPAKSAHKYATIWTQQGSPLAVHTQLLTEALKQRIAKTHGDVLVDYAMTYGEPGLKKRVDELIRVEGVGQLLVFPLYPQYSATTTASIWDAVFKVCQKLRNPPALRLVKHYHDDPGYIQALAAQVRQHWQKHPWAEGEKKMLVLTFHGLPRRNLLLGDPYFCECQKTARLLKAALGLDADEVQVTFQSRFGKAEWLQPYTQASIESLAKTHSRVDVFCPGFVSDCLETLEEIAMEVKDAYIAAGGTTFHYIEALNESEHWLNALEALVSQQLLGWESTPATQEALLARAKTAIVLGAKQ